VATEGSAFSDDLLLATFSICHPSPAPSTVCHPSRLRFGDAGDPLFPPTATMWAKSHIVGQQSLDLARRGGLDTRPHWIPSPHVSVSQLHQKENFGTDHRTLARSGRFAAAFV